MQPLYYKVKIAFGDDEYISITAAELPRAIKAQVNGGIAVFSEGSVSGNNIISITPDWGRVLGRTRGYKLDGEDYAKIPMSLVGEASLAIENAKTEVLGSSKPSHLLDGPEK